MDHGPKQESADDVRRQLHITDAPQVIPGRRSFLAYFSTLGLGSTLLPGVLWGKMQDQKSPTITKAMLRDAASVAGLTFTDQQLDAVLDGGATSVGVESTVLDVGALTIYRPGAVTAEMIAAVASPV